MRVTYVHSQWTYVSINLIMKVLVLPLIFFLLLYICLIEVDSRSFD